ncbi:pectate lyase [Paractinoplanes atraurantiacus]|uniref:pectate lyase n=1 Tax=Paractinoplanes atraurantiacus TaxID=1036182 RepID=A0A285IYI7_9ACTN|nr:pectate lyase [Actinoplanes atraurantiacus]SNY52737.1 Pectate lyase [Actinoplanes atraurantiacus]
MKYAKGALIGGVAVLAVAAAGLTATAFAAGGPSFGDTFEDGDTSGWSKSGGSWSVVTDGSKALRQADNGSELARFFAGDTSWTDYSVQASVRPLTLASSGASAGIAARASGSHEFERLVLASGTARLEEVKGSAVTVLGSLALPAAGSGWHKLRLDVSGKRVTGYVDGKVVGDVSTAKLTKGRIGLLTVDASASFDDISVGTAGNTPTTAPTATPTTATPTTATAAPTATAKPTTAAPTATTAAPTATATAKPTTAAPTVTASPVATTWPTPVSTTTLTATRKITGSVDGGNVRFVGGGDLGGDGQDEGQDPLFQLADGATLSNVIIGSPAADGVHCLGTCTLRNVWWQDVGEDAATFKGTSASQTMTVIGGGAMHASDKTFQHNGPGTFVIKDFQASDIGKLYRSCGNCSKQYARKVQVSNVTVTTPLKALVGVNANLGDVATVDKVTVVGGTSKTVICAIFKGVTSGEPTQTSSVPDGKSCTATNITLK